jgi:2'-5' RNA ligase
MTTRFPSYIVAEIPEPVRSGIQALRDSFPTPTALLPVEITLLGSSGIGPVPAGTPIGLIEDQIDSLFSTVAPWEVSFSGIRIFPHTSIAYLAPADRRPFDDLHGMLRDSCIPHSVSPFPYNPHCTVRSGNATPQELSRVLGHAFPTKSFMIDTISVYDLNLESIHCDLIYQKQLKA